MLLESKPWRSSVPAGIPHNPNINHGGFSSLPTPAVMIKVTWEVCRGDTHTPAGHLLQALRIGVYLDTEGSKGKQKNAIIYKTEAAGDEALLKKTFESGWIAYSSRE